MSRSITYHRDRLDAYLGAKKLVFDEARFEPPGEGLFDHIDVFEGPEGPLPLKIIPADSSPRLDLGRFGEFGDDIEPCFDEEGRWIPISRRRLRDIRFFFVGGMRPLPRSSALQPKIRVIIPTICRFLMWQLSCLDAEVRNQVEVLRRKLAAAKRAAEQKNLSAIARDIALVHLDILLERLACLAVEAMKAIKPIPPPRVLSAGGWAGAWIPMI